MILSALFPAESAAQATFPQNKIDRHSMLSFLTIIPLILSLMNELKQTAALPLVCLAGTALLLIRSFYQSAQH
jgi:cobalamin synthase